MALDVPALPQPLGQRVVAFVAHVHQGLIGPTELPRVELPSGQQGVDRLVVARARGVEQAVVAFELDVGGRPGGVGLAALAWLGWPGWGGRDGVAWLGCPGWGGLAGVGWKCCPGWGALAGLSCLNSDRLYLLCRFRLT